MYGVGPMTTGRKLRLALSAAILAALFTFVLVGHAGAHAEIAADPPCAMCSSAEVATISAPEAPVFDAPRILRFASEVRLLPEAASQYPPRGPPLAG